MPSAALVEPEHTAQRQKREDCPRKEYKGANLGALAE